MSFFKNLLSVFKNVFGIGSSEKKKDNDKDNDKGDEKESISKKFDYDEVLTRRKRLRTKHRIIRIIPNTGISGTIVYGHTEGAQYSQYQIVLIADSMLHYQNPDGGWGKDGHYRINFSEEEWTKIYETPSEARYQRRESDFDNGCTWGHLQYLSHVYKATKEEIFSESARKALRFIVESQHENGSWENKNHRHITYNDDVMAGVLGTILDILNNDGGLYDFLQDLVSELKLEEVYMRGIQCVLDTQIETDGVKGVWAQQHDHKTLKPTWARSYEMPAYVSRESFGVIRLLRNHLKRYPKDLRVFASIDAALDFLRKVRLPDGRFARYYHLENLRPIFANRDGTITYDINDLLPERRNGYGWIVECPPDIL